MRRAAQNFASFPHRPTPSLEHQHEGIGAPGHHAYLVASGHFRDHP